MRRWRDGEDNFFLVFGAIPDDGQRADAGVRGEGNGEAALLGDIVGDDRGGHLVHLEAAVLLRDIDRGKSEFAGLADQAARDVELLGFDAVRQRHHFVGGEVGGGARNLAMLFGEIFGEEAVCGFGCSDKKAAAGYDSVAG